MNPIALKPLRIVFAIIVLFASSLVSAMPAAAGGPAPGVPAAGRAIPGHYIVTVKPGRDVRAVAAIAGVTPSHVYDAAINGFAA